MVRMKPATEIGLAIGFAAPLRIFPHRLHRKGGHGDNRDGPQIIVFLEPLVTSRPDTSGSWMSIKIKSGRVAGANRSASTPSRLSREIAMRFEKMVEKLHVRVVILDNQHALSGPARQDRRPASSFRTSFSPGPKCRRSWLRRAPRGPTGRAGPSQSHSRRFTAWFNNCRTEW